MRAFTFKGLFLTVVFMLLGCLTIQAADDDLITRQITVKLDKAGTLPNMIASSEMYKITNLKIVGKINGTDLRMIREMAGSDYYGNSTKGNLSVLDLSEAKIVEGGDYYYYYSYYNDTYYTSNDKIGDYAFYNCSRLTSLTLPAGITSIGEGAFWHCSGLTSLNLPAGITTIGYAAFSGCSGLTSLTLPAGITEIYGSAFKNCTGLTSLNLPAGITSIGGGAFYGCSRLKEVRFCINDNLDTYLTKGHPYIDVDCGIKYYINDKEITSIVIPSSVTSLGNYAFQKCSTLQSVYVSWSTPISAGKAFDEFDTSKCTLYVPQGTEQDYWLAVIWCDFGNIVEYDATGIEKTTTSTDVKEVSRYSVNGQRLVGPTKGLNIVKYSDGSVKKVAVE